MTKVYHKTFAASALDKERDEALAVRMTALSFIKPQHLDIPKTFQDEKAWLLAMKELHKINSYKVGISLATHLQDISAGVYFMSDLLHQSGMIYAGCLCRHPETSWSASSTAAGSSTIYCTCPSSRARQEV